MLWWLGCPAVLAAGVAATCGAQGAVLLGGQATLGVLLLEVINYVEVCAVQPVPLVTRLPVLQRMHHFSLLLWHAALRADTPAPAKRQV